MLEIETLWNLPFENFSQGGIISSETSRLIYSRDVDHRLQNFTQCCQSADLVTKRKKYVLQFLKSSVLVRFWVVFISKYKVLTIK